MMQYKSILYFILFFCIVIVVSCTPGKGVYSSVKKPSKNTNKVSINFSLDTLQYVFLEGAFVESNLDSKATSLSGEDDFIQSMLRSIRYPKIARENRVEGTCVIQIVVNESGEMESASIVRDIGAGCGKEALRVLKNAGKVGFSPAIINGLPVKVRFNVPVVFSMG